MMGMSRNRRRAFTTPCDHKCTCYCHHPETEAYKEKQKANNWHDFKLCIGVLGFLVLLFTGLYFIIPTPVKTYIEVDGKMCEVQFKRTGSTSTGGAIGHEIAVCK